MAQHHSAHGATAGKSRMGPYSMLWLNMVLGLAVMYFAMFAMIDGCADFSNNLNIFTWR
jgi:hypothetical protein